MKPIEFKRLMAALGKLSASECLEAQTTLRKRERQVEASLALREAERDMKSCPHCGCDQLASAGSKDGRKRFKCKACSKTFNAYTGTLLARLRMAEKHVEHAGLMVEGLSVRKTAARLGIDVHTAFRWRRRFLQTARKAQPAKLSGVVEADEWASPDSPDTFNNMMCSGDINDEDKKELHGRVQA